MYKRFPSRERKVKSSKIAQYVSAISRLRKRIVQSQDCLHNLEIDTPFRDSENALHNLEIAQIPKLCGTASLAQPFYPRLYTTNPTLGSSLCKLLSPDGVRFCLLCPDLVRFSCCSPITTALANVSISASATAPRTSVSTSCNY